MDQSGTSTRLEGAPSAAPRKDHPSIAGDILYGAEAIAQFLYGDRQERRRVYHHAARRSIPHFKIGTMICARRSVLLEWIARQEDEANG